MPHPLVRALRIVATASVAACALVVAPGDARAHDEAPLVVPVAPLVGRLVLPAREARRADGGVFFVVEHAPDDLAHLVGARAWLAFDPRSPVLMERVARATVDVRFSDDVREAAREGTIYPERIDGWTRVSPLESLAAAHPEDDVRVSLDGARVVVTRKGATFFIDRAPVAVAGTHEALVRFVSSKDAARGRVRVAHWSRATRDFTGPVVDLDFAPADARAQGGSPASSLMDIERTPENAAGYLVTGTRDARGRFVIHALAPYGLFSVEPNVVRSGADARRFLHDESFSNLEREPHGSWRVLLRSGNDTPRAPWSLGERALVVHLFGSTGGARGEPLRWRILSAGHFSLGTATVIVDRITGEPRFDIVYHQLYGGNPDGILAGRTAWSLYMGSLRNGVMYRRPVSDLLIRHPALATAGRDKLDPLDELAHELDVMAARWRTGDGEGGVVIDAAQNCVQDASAALFIAMRRFEREVLAAPSVRALDAEDSEKARLDALARLLERIEARLIPAGGLRSDWREAASLAVVRERRASTPRTLARAALTWRTMLPRAAHDAIGELALDEGADVVVLRTNLQGGVIEGIRPLPPRSLTRR